MSDSEQPPTTPRKPKSSIIDYVGNFVEKRDNQLRAETSDEEEGDGGLRRGIDKDAIVIDRGEFQRTPGDVRDSESTDIDVEELSLDNDPVVQTRDGGEKVYKQQVFLRQYQPPTPEPVDIQVQEVLIKPQVQRPPIHVHVNRNSGRDEQRTPSPILIKSAPPRPPSADSTGPIIYNKYVPVDYKPSPQQIIIHRYPEMPPKPRPIVVEQWLPNKPAPKRITYHRVGHEEMEQTQAAHTRNLYIEYTKPHTTIELEIVRLPVITMSPSDYQNGDRSRRIDDLRNFKQDANTLLWRI